MTGNFNKFLSKTIITYTFLLVIIFILKLVGLDYFGLDTKNHIIIYLSELSQKSLIINNIIFCIPLFINQYIILCLVSNDNSKKMKIYNLILSPIFYIFQGVKLNIFGNFSFFVEVLYFMIVTIVYNKCLNKEIMKRFFKTIIFVMAVQLLSIFTRVHYSIEYISNPILNIILNLDYILVLLIAYKLHFMKGGKEICGCQVVQCSSLQKQISLRKLLKQLQRNLDNFNKKSKVEKIEISIYLILCLFWNVFTLVLVLFVAKLNNTFIECIFILTSFWLSKGTFGKPFHFQSMTKCFIVSNITYYVLNRVTTPLGISIIVPIILGVGLSYVTSKFVKIPITKLYKGMPEDEFNNNILRVIDKDSLQYKICHMFYVERKSELEIAHNVGYSIDNIKKIKSKINKKIKELK